MSFKWFEIKKPVFVLAPMANITTLPFRSICKEMGADIVFTPMLSSNAIVYNPEETLKIAEFMPAEQPVIVQIFGYDGEIIAKAANIVQKKLKPAGIDINMGCPAPKITGNECGSALLRDYDKALLIAKTVRESFKGQLSVKLRLGWRDNDVKSFVKELENIGIDAVSIHGRTTKQGYKGEADWKPIYEIVDEISIPVIGNGDITSAKQAWERLDGSKLAGVMIGRGALGNPWIFREIKQSTFPVIPAKAGIQAPENEMGPWFLPTLGFGRTGATRNDKRELERIILKQAKLSIKYLGNEKLAMLELRKHLGWYLRGFAGAQALRTRAMKVETMKELKRLLKDLT